MGGGRLLSAGAVRAAGRLPPPWLQGMERAVRGQPRPGWGVTQCSTAVRGGCAEEGRWHWGARADWLHSGGHATPQLLNAGRPQQQSGDRPRQHQRESAQHSSAMDLDPCAAPTGGCGAVLGMAVVVHVLSGTGALASVSLVQRSVLSHGHVTQHGEDNTHAQSRTNSCRAMHCTSIHT